jgi:PrtD family type I secretion system ABC transporter
MLAGPLYMLQIYDRVLSSRSVPTLIALSLILIFVYLLQFSLDVIRSRIVVRSAALMDRHLDVIVHNAVVRIAPLTRNAGEAHQPVRDLDQIRSFLTSNGPIAIVDLPWMPIFLLFCFLIHPWLGSLSLGAAFILMVTTILTERGSRKPVQEVTRGGATRSVSIEAGRRNAETVLAMGMLGALAERWRVANRTYLAAVEQSADVSNFFGSIAKVLRMLLQSAILGLGAYLVIQNELTAGAMIAASIMMARALAPIETAIANWRGFVNARQSFRRLSDILQRIRPELTKTELMRPAHSLDVENVTVAAPGGQVPILTDARFRLEAGETLGLIGPSGCGKTSLVRTLVGVWCPARGAVRLDGAALDQWDSEQLGCHIGYLSQTVELFDGTVAENIARMSPEPDSAAVIEAAQIAGAHEMILRFPGGYDTRIGDAGAILSAGQRQRIALARALFRNPFLVVLDEPNANLDQEGEQALLNAIARLKERGAIVIVVAHRLIALSVCEKILLLANGVQQAFGPRESVLRPTPARTVVPVPAAGAGVAGLRAAE